MRIKTKQPLIKYFIACIFSILCLHSIAQTTSYKCEIKNISQIDAKNFTFEIWFTNTGTTTLQLLGFQAGIDFNYAGLVNGGSVTASFVPGSGFLTPECFIDPASKQIRLPVFLIDDVNTAPAIPVSVGIRYAKIKVTNTVNFGPVSPGLAWSYTVSSNQKTQTAMICYINGQDSPFDLTDAASQQIGGNPIINANSITTLPEWGLILLGFTLVLSSSIFILRRGTLA